MILTGKALENFTKWNGDRHFDMMLPFEYPIYLNALIIEWFDSVGIYVTVNYNFIQAKFTNSVKDKDTILYRGMLYSTRQEATEQAIIHANKIHNETKA